MNPLETPREELINAAMVKYRHLMTAAFVMLMVFVISLFLAFWIEWNIVWRVGATGMLGFSVFLGLFLFLKKKAGTYIDNLREDYKRNNPQE